MELDIPALPYHFAFHPMSYYSFILAHRFHAIVTSFAVGHVAIVYIPQILAYLIGQGSLISHDSALWPGHSVHPFYRRRALPVWVRRAQ